MTIAQSDIDALDAAMALSELRVEIDGKMVQYRSVAEMLEARRHLSALVSGSSSSTRRRAYQFQFTTARGD